MAIGRAAFIWFSFFFLFEYAFLFGHLRVPSAGDILLGHCWDYFQLEGQLMLSLKLCNKKLDICFSKDPEPCGSAYINKKKRIEKLDICCCNAHT